MIPIGGISMQKMQYSKQYWHTIIIWDQRKINMVVLLHLKDIGSFCPSSMYNCWLLGFLMRDWPPTLCCWWIGHSVKATGSRNFSFTAGATRTEKAITPLSSILYSLSTSYRKHIANNPLWVVLQYSYRYCYPSNGSWDADSPMPHTNW